MISRVQNDLGHICLVSPKMTESLNCEFWYSEEVWSLQMTRSFDYETHGMPNHLKTNKEFYQKMSIQNTFNTFYVPIYRALYIRFQFPDS